MLLFSHESFLQKIRLISETYFRPHGEHRLIIMRLSDVSPTQVELSSMGKLGHWVLHIASTSQDWSVTSECLRSESYWKDFVDLGGCFYRRGVTINEAQDR